MLDYVENDWLWSEPAASRIIKVYNGLKSYLFLFKEMYSAILTAFSGNP
jgi:hypothetical protein